ncbi:MAG: hypothetical protein ABL959_13525 [Pyrinomonadaceae bacterium]
MKRQIMSISLPADMSMWIRELVEDSDFASVSDYFRALVRTDRQRRRIYAAEQREHRARIARSMSERIDSCGQPHGQRHW